MHTTRLALSVTVLVADVLSAAAALAAARPGGAPLPEMVVTRAAAPPTIDGRMEPGEWDRAPAATAFTTAFQDELSRIQSVAWVAYDDRFLYVCLKNYRGPTYTLLKKLARAPDDENIVYDHANEIWITPPASPLATYQTLLNSYPAVLDVKKIPSVGYTAKSWTGNWKIAATETGDYWIVEGRAPLESFGAKGIRDGDTWRALFTTDVIGRDTGGFRAWAPGGAFEDINRHGYLHFSQDGPVFQFLDVETIFTGKFRFPMAVAAGSKAACRATVKVRFGGAVEPASGDLVLTKTVSAAAGAREEFEITGDLAGLALPARKVAEPGSKEQKDVPGGYCEVTAATAEGARLYHQVFPFVIDGYRRAPPAEIMKTPYETPFGLQAFYATLARRLIVRIDRYYMDARAEAVAGTARLLEGGSGKAVAERRIAPFQYDYSEFPMDLGSLKVPVQTEAEWAKAKPVEEENRKIAAENKKAKAEGKPETPLKEVPGVKPAAYDLEVAITNKDGKELARTTVPVKLMGCQFEWLPNEVGISDKVIPPWTPVEWGDGQVSVWNRTYRLTGLGLAEKITNAGRPQLSGPMRLIATVDGKPQAVESGRPSLVRLTEAGADLAGAGRAGDLELAVTTRVEFDGFVLNRMTIAPKRAARIDRLTLEVSMPRSEAPCFVTTAGGWAAYHGWTPERWDSRETSSGSRMFNFVPYVFLTDSERGFSWFADSTRGWVLDPAKPTQELECRGDTVALRIHFVTRPGTIEKPTTVEYGWMTTPQKPQPHAWRAYNIANSRPYRHATSVFWNDADWAVLWPYYSSPYPWDMEKSKKAIDAATARGVTGCVGAIAHAIARYRDYGGRWFNDLAADWGESPGVLSNGNVARGRGPNDFQVWHYDRWVKQAGLPGLYFDENYLGEDFNYLSGGAYLAPDERIEPGYSYLGLREYNKRLRYMFRANGKAPPNLWLHTTSGHPVYAWMPDVAMEGENVEPTAPADYMDCLPASRLRSIGMGANLGAAPFIMCQADRHWNEAHSPFTVPQFVGWVLAHDCLPEGAAFWPVLASEMGMWRDDIRFLPYWKPGLGVESKTAEVLVSAHVRPGQAVLWIVNTSHEDRRATVAVDMKRLGLDAAASIAFDAETGERCQFSGGALAVDVPKRFWRAVRIVQPKLLAAGETFVAHFDGGAVEADEALGHPYPLPDKSATAPTADAEGKSGKGCALDQALVFGARHNVPVEDGRMAFQVKVPAGASGVLVETGRWKVSLGKAGLTLAFLAETPTGEGAMRHGPSLVASATGTRWETLATAALPAAPEGGWREFRISWRGKEMKVQASGQELAAATLPEPPFRPLGRGRDIQDYRLRTRAAAITFGPLKGAVMDDLVIGR